MLRRATVVLFTVVLAAGLGYAQGAKVGGEARQLAMGGSNLGTGIVLNPYITEDPALLLLNPAYQTHYMNYSWWNVGGGTVNGLSTGDNGYGKQNAGVSIGLGKDLVIGTVLSYDPSAVNVVNKILQGGTALSPLPLTLPGYIPAGGRGNGVTGAQTIPAVANVWEVLAGYKSGSLDLGFGFSYGSSNSDETASASGGTSASREASSHMFGFRLGMIMDMGGGSNFSAHGAVRLDKATDDVDLNPKVNGQGGDWSASGTEIELSARLKLHVSNRFSFVPYGAFLLVTASPNEDTPPTGVTALTRSQKLTATGITVGAGGEYKISNFLLAGGLSYQSLSGKFEDTYPAPTPSTTSKVTYSSVPTINLGAEWWLTDWLAARGGYFRMLGKVNNKTDVSNGTASTSTETNVTTPLSYSFIGGIGAASWDGVVTLGIGVRFGNFSLDATVSDEALRRGLGLIGGSQDNINTFGYITMNYSFD
ncbi:MAG TPA: hypothetical protein VMG09_07045 [Bacteroidota bacterium]|nr:hypothetical protein [Bacteroidota bacterium]